MDRYQYCLKIAGIYILLDSDYEITFRHNTTPFLSDQLISSDVIIQICEDRQILIQKKGIRQGDRYYIDDGITNELIVFSHGDIPGFHFSSYYGSDRWIVHYTSAYKQHIKYIDVLLGYIGIENLLRCRHGILLHSSLIKWENQSILFSAPSGTGKSTQADLWVKYKGASIINGDRACIIKISNTWYAFGSPYAGSSGIYVNDGAPIASLFLLKQASANKLIKVNETEAVKFLFPEIVMHHWDPYFVNDILGYLSELIRDIPVYILECTPDFSAVNEVMKVIGK